MTSWNGLHKLPIVISGKTPKTLSIIWIKASKIVRWWITNKKSFEHIWQPEKRMVISFYHILLPITNSIKMKLNVYKIFNNTYSKFHICLKRISWLHWINFKLELECVKWVGNSTPDSKIPNSNPTEVFNWSLGLDPNTRLLLIKQIKHNDYHQVSKADSPC